MNVIRFLTSLRPSNAESSNPAGIERPRLEAVAGGDPIAPDRLGKYRPPCCEPVPLIRAEGLSMRYGAHPAFRDVTLSIPRGCVTALVGPSGCGKTSFLSSLNRLSDLVPGARVSGRLLLGDLDVLAPATDAVTLRRRVGMIFQKPAPFPLSIRRNLEFPLREHGIRHRTELAGRVRSALEDVGLWEEVKDRLDSPALALSGGQQQRLCLARALALEPEVLLLDEPCSSLDPLSSGLVEDRIAALRGRYTVVVVTHNLAQARRIADWVALFWVRDGAGSLVESASVQDFFESPRHPLAAAYVRGARG